MARPTVLPRKGQHAMSNALARQIRETAKLTGTFTLRSGAISNTYFDKYLLASQPALLHDIGQEMANLVPAETEVLAGLEMGGIPLVVMLSQLTGLPAAFIRKEPKKYGTCKYAEGPPLNGKRVTVVEDVVSSGGAILDALRLLQQDDIEPIAIICMIDRQSQGAENLAKAGYQLRAAFTMEQIETAT